MKATPAFSMCKALAEAYVHACKVKGVPHADNAAVCDGRVLDVLYRGAIVSQGVPLPTSTAFSSSKSVKPALVSQSSFRSVASSFVETPHSQSSAASRSVFPADVDPTAPMGSGNAGLKVLGSLTHEEIRYLPTITVSLVAASRTGGSIVQQSCV